MKIETKFNPGDRLYYFENGNIRYFDAVRVTIHAYKIFEGLDISYHGSGNVMKFEYDVFENVEEINRKQGE